jgi:parallel beta-helix repeat protein/predicted outer membrane repeat protein
MSEYSARVSVARVLFIVLISLIVVTAGCNKKKDKDLPPPVVTGQPPEANFTATPTSGEAPLTVQFFDTSTGDVTSWEWDFDNDGTPDSDLQYPNHEYASPGWYTVKLTVSNNEGSDSCVKEQYILVAESILTAAPAGGDYTTIQDAIDAASDFDLVEVANGTWIGAGNKELDFGGKKVYLKSQGGAAFCVIDCENSGRGFYFHSGETEDSVVDGFTIKNGNIGEDGGGIYCYSSSSPTITNCVITSNTTTKGGGGIACRNSCIATVRNCVITGNSANSGGGGIYCKYSNATFTGCEINTNSAGFGGGGAYCDSSSPVFTNCQFKSNTTTGGGGAIRGSTSGAKFTNCVIEENTAASGGAGNFSYGVGPLFTGCTVKSNTATSGNGGAFRLFATRKAAAQTFVNCLIQNNSAASDGGGIALDDQARPIIINCVISGNTAGEDGGGVWFSYRCDAHFINCIIANNSSVGNGGGLCPETDTDIILDNSIIWGNTATGTGNQIYVLATGMASSATLNYCDYANDTGDIYEASAVIATGCKSVNPVFTDGFFHIHPLSPCIDAGENTFVPGTITEDLDGNTRIENGTVDIGPYEYGE